MKEHFDQFAVIPLEGNHDFVDLNSQDFTINDPMIAYNLEHWKDYLDESSQEQYKDFGYYHQMLRTSDGTEYENTRIIALNTQSCYHFNYYLFSDHNDPGNELAWLEEELTKMESEGKNAIILAHVPPGSEDCLYQWAIRYNALMDRFQHVVRFSIHGHKHIEKHSTVRSIDDRTPIGIQYWSSSGTTFTDVNPSYRVFEVEAETMLPVRVETYFFDIS